jgi:prolyl oligopeptidase
MKRSAPVVAIALVLSCTHASETRPPPGIYDYGIVYPATAKVEHVDDYHGVQVADPYRWLEDLDSDATARWVKEQNQLTRSYLERIPERAQIRKRLTELWDFEKYGVPVKRGDRYFFTRNDGLQDQGVLYWSEALDAEPRVLLDPNSMSEDGMVALSGYSVSPDGNMVAYGLQIAGSDWVLWKVRNVDNGRDVPGSLKWIKWSRISWTNDNMGFFYSRFPKPKKGASREALNFFNKLYYHRLGTKQREDVLVYESRDNKEWRFDGEVTDDGRILVISVTKGTDDRNMVLYKRLDLGADEPVKTLIGDFFYEYTLVGNEGPILYFETTNEAPRGRIVAIDTREPGPDGWRQVVPQVHGTLESADMFGDRLLLTYLLDAHNEIEIFDLDGNRRGEIALPGIGTTWGFYGRRDVGETFYAFTSFTQPTTIYRYELGRGQSTIFRQPKVAFDTAAYETTQVFYESEDGTQIPMFISHKRGLALDGSNPTYLYGYGGFKISLTPWFNISNSVWMEMGGVLAVACLRGGGEYGDEWHEAGRLKNKQNVFDDFAAAAEWLIENKYTSTPRLAIGGGSNGGLLVGASITQRPELFGAAVAQVGVFDMLRFHKYTIGWAWADDYGTSDDPGQFQILRAYSPLHNVAPGAKFPATLLTTADHDDRVVPSHSFKFVSTLQAAQAGSDPILIRVDERAGHGRGKPTSKRIEEATDTWAFLVRELGVGGPEAAADHAVADEDGVEQAPQEAAGSTR